MDVVTPAGPLDKGDITTQVYAPAPEDNIDDTEGETGIPEGASSVEPSVTDPNGECPSEHQVAHKRSTACGPLPSPPHSPVLRQKDGRSSPDGAAPHTPPSRRVSSQGHGKGRPSGDARPQPPPPPRKSGTRGTLQVEDAVGIPMFTNPDGTVTYIPGMVPETPCPTKSALKQYDSTISCSVECAFDEPDRIDWDSAEAKQIKSKVITTCGTKSLYRICKEMQPPLSPEHIPLYRNWLLYDSAESQHLSPELLPSERFAKLDEGIRLPYPSGTANSQGGFGCTNCKTDRVDQNRLESRSMEISPWGLVVFSCLDCDVREVS